MILIKSGAETPIYLQLDKDDTEQYPNAYIYDYQGAEIAIVELDRMPDSDTTYFGYLTIITEGFYQAKFIVYSDSGRTVENENYKLSEETIKVSELEQNVEDIKNGKFGKPYADFS